MAAHAVGGVRQQGDIAIASVGGQRGREGAAVYQHRCAVLDQRWARQRPAALVGRDEVDRQGQAAGRIGGVGGDDGGDARVVGGRVLAHSLGSPGSGGQQQEPQPPEAQESDVEPCHACFPLMARAYASPAAAMGFRPRRAAVERRWARPWPWA